MDRDRQKYRQGYRDKDRDRRATGTGKDKGTDRSLGKRSCRSNGQAGLMGTGTSMGTKTCKVLHRNGRRNNEESHQLFAIVLEGPIFFGQADPSGQSAVKGQQGFRNRRPGTDRASGTKICQVISYLDGWLVARQFSIQTLVLLAKVLHPGQVSAVVIRPH